MNQSKESSSLRGAPKGVPSFAEVVSGTSELEQSVLKAALESFVRAQMGRADQVMERVIFNGRRSDGRLLSAQETCAARELLEKASEIVTGARYGGPGIFSERVPDEARVAFRLLKQLQGDDFAAEMVSSDGKVKNPR